MSYHKTNGPPKDLRRWGAPSEGRASQWRKLFSFTFLTALICCKIVQSQQFIFIHDAICTGCSD